MERNDNIGGAGQYGSGSAGGDFGGSDVGSSAGSQGFAGSGAAGASQGFSGGSTAGSATGGAGATDAAGNRLRDAKNAAADKLGTVREKASNLSATLADRLEAGAEKLRQRGQANQFAGVDGSTVGSGNEQMSALTNRLAGGMQGTADMLRNGDLKGSIETQVRDNPARTLLIAVGLGYLLGKALKK